MTPLTTDVFSLAEHPAKADPRLIAADEAHFAAIADSLERSVADLSDAATPRSGSPAAPTRRPWTATRRSTASPSGCAP